MKIHIKFSKLGNRVIAEQVGHFILHPADLDLIAGTPFVPQAY